MRVTSPPENLSFWHPACLAATWFGSGFMPYTPATFASAVALPIGWAIHLHAGWVGLVIAAIAAFTVGLWASGIYIERSGIDDPGQVVIDEVAGQWLTLAVVPLNPLFYVLAFILFRIADILKPWPASWADRSVAGPWGVMMDDIFAAFYAGAVLLLLDNWVL
jgi:phosphatidylglycerophosphatase A